MSGLRTLTALTGGDQAGEGIDDKQLRRLMEALAASGQMRAHWTIDEATDALGALTSYATYERLRCAPRPDRAPASPRSAARRLRRGRPSQRRTERVRRRAARRSGGSP